METELLSQYNYRRGAKVVIKERIPSKEEEEKFEYAFAKIGKDNLNNEIVFLFSSIQFVVNGGGNIKVVNTDRYDPNDPPYYLLDTNIRVLGCPVDPEPGEITLKNANKILVDLARSIEKFTHEIQTKLDIDENLEFNF